MGREFGIIIVDGLDVEYGLVGAVEVSASSNSESEKSSRGVGPSGSESLVRLVPSVAPEMRLDTERFVAVERRPAAVRRR